jgi:hypothetical protein
MVDAGDDGAVAPQQPLTHANKRIGHFTRVLESFLCCNVFAGRVL